MSSVEQLCVIIVPCFNEQTRLPISQFSCFIEATPQVRFLLVNDGSTDCTLAILRGLETRYPANVSVLDLQSNVGKAEAVRRGLLAGISHGEAPYAGFWDADLATPLESISDMKGVFDQNPHVQMVFGARVRLLGRSIHRRATRHYLGRVFASVVSLLLKLPVYDTQCGAKLFRITPDLLQIFATPFHSKWIFDVEIVARFLHLNKNDTHYVSAAIYELPLTRWEDVAGSHVSSKDFLTAIVELAYIRNTYLLSVDRTTPIEPNKQENAG
jgi:dolichyl-phosphate beta-glucosyltransferase